MSGKLGGPSISGRYQKNPSKDYPQSPNWRNYWLHLPTNDVDQRGGLRIIVGSVVE